MTVYTQNGADISLGGTYRYLLWREWEQGEGTALFIMLNPSTADAILDDATIRRCVTFTQQLGYNRLEVTNLFAFRARDPADLKRAKSPVGPRNYEVLQDRARHADTIICAWGKHGAYRGQASLVRERILGNYPLYALHLLQDGTPGHPLYLPNDSKLKRL